MATSAELMPGKITKVLMLSTFMGSLGGSLMPLLFNYSLVSERGVSVRAISAVLIAGPLGLLCGNRFFVPFTSRFSSKKLMMLGQLGFAASLIPALRGTDQAVLMSSMFSAFFFISLYLPARSEYIVLVGKRGCSIGAADFRSKLRFVSYLATGMASIIAVSAIFSLNGYLYLFSIVSNVCARILCALIISRLPNIDNQSTGEKQSLAFGRCSGSQIRSHYLFSRYGLITFVLCLIASVCGSFSFLLPLVFAEYSIAGSRAFPLILGAMTIFAGILHRNDILTNFASQKRLQAVKLCLFLSGMAFAVLYCSLSREFAAAIFVSILAVALLALCNVIAITVQWEYSYSIRSQDDTRLYEATDGFIQTIIGLVLPSGLSLLLSLFEIKVFMAIGVVLFVSALLLLGFRTRPA
ncbi:hypothetical protein HW450_06450 [Corynebacterium hindlerae]|uniref:MFS transporter n=1 Tax=Corynebacterium hindlerae TaxID=699041 RepID=A0A7G5FI92_9CORY|nr:hypothetical protein [Corynebacterium hindlerae]QMV86333.1 hypothetical protein HW450_06450 [Corynebacterium hindlerae]